MLAFEAARPEVAAPGRVLARCVVARGRGRTEHPDPMKRALRLLLVVAALMMASASGAGDASRFRVRSGGAWGYIDRAGTVVIPPRFEAAEPFSEGLAAVKLAGSHGYIDTSGKVVLRPRFAPAGAVHRPFGSGRAAVKVGDLYGYMDTSGNLVGQGRYLRADDFSGGFGLGCTRDECWYIDPAGRHVVSIGTMGGTPAHDGMAGIYVAMAMGRERVEILDLSSRRRLPGVFEGLGKLSEGLIAARLGRSWGWLDRAGRGVIAPSFEWAGDFSEGLAPAKDASGRCGYVDRSGKYAVPPRYGRCGPFSSGRARVDLATAEFEGERVAFIDRSGRVVVEGATAEPRFDSAEDFVDGLAVVGAGGEPRFAGSGPLLGYIDAAGRYVWTPRD